MANQHLSVILLMSVMVIISFSSTVAAPPDIVFTPCGGDEKGIRKALQKKHPYATKMRIRNCHHEGSETACVKVSLAPEAAFKRICFDLWGQDTF